jgi:hypothetical protein
MDDQPATAEPVKPRRRWYRFGLRTLLICVTLAGCGLGWLGFKVREARQQAAVIALIEKLGGGVQYDYQFDAQGNYQPDTEPPGPAWLHALLGDDFFRNPSQVILSITSTNDADLECLQGLKELKIVISQFHTGDRCRIAAPQRDGATRRAVA